MAVISELIIDGEITTSHESLPITEIYHDGNTVEGFPSGIYHFAKESEAIETCENAVAEPIIDLKISGNSVQDGTPTPENPIEIESVGDRTANLFNIETYNTIAFDVSKCKVGTALTISTKDVYYYKLSNSPTGVGNYQYKTNKHTYILTQEHIDLGRIYILSPSTWKPETKENLMSQNVQIEYGETATEYEPYGYRVPVKVSGKNLFDKNKLTGGGEFVEFNGVECYKYKDTNGAIFHYSDNFKENTQYTISAQIYRDTFDKPNAINIYYTDGTLDNMWNVRNFQTFTTAAGKTIEKITGWNGYNQDAYLDLETFQIEEGTTKTDYEPYIEPTTTNIYLNEPLRKIGEYADYIDYKNKKVFRNIGEKAFNGTENWISNANPAGKYRARINGFAKKATSTYKKADVLSNMYMAQPTNNFYSGTSEGIGIDDNGNLQIYDSAFYDNKDISIWKSHLSELYNNGNPLVAVYVLTTPTEETIEIPEISTFKGTNVFDVDTNIEPSAIELRYWKQI